MALVFNDRVKETSTTTGTGTLDLGGAFQDFQTFVAGIGNSNETYYNIVLPQTGEFEVGRGVVTDASPDTLSRLEVFTSSNNNNLVDFSAGTKTVFCTLPANKFVPGKFEGANFADSILIGHATTGTLNAAEDNTGIGIEALDAITSGDANIAIGSEALTNLTTAIDNTVVGTHSGTSIVGGNFNTIFGKGSGNAINSGTYNIILGRSTNTTSTTGSGNVMIGNERQPSSNSVNGELKIGNFIPGTGSLDWISGDNTGALTFADKVVLGANKVIEFGDSSDTIKGDGTKITVNSSGRLDLLGTSVFLNGSGTTAVLISSQGVQFGDITKENGTDLVVKSSVSDGDLVLRGNDGGSAIDALSFDMSEAGAATFNSTVTANAGLKADNITIDGTEIDLSSGDLKIDSAGDITLDADGGDVIFEDASTEIGRFTNDSTDFAIKSSVQDKDIVFKGNDGGSTITAMRLDISNKGRVTIGSNNFPAERLSVFGEDNTAAATFKVKDTDSRGVLIESPYSGFGVGYVGTDGTNSALGFKVNGTEVGRFGTNGFLGIGTNNPQEEIHINGADPSIRIQDSDGGLATITQAGNNLSFDVPGVIQLDAGGASIEFLDDGLSFLKIENSSSDAHLRSIVQDKDILLRGNDGGSQITALTLDMSEAGAATFNDKIILGASKVIEFGDAGETIFGDGTDLTIVSSNDATIDVTGQINLDAGDIGRIHLMHDGTTYGHILRSGQNLELKSSISDGDFEIHGNDGGVSINALKLDMSEAGAATFNDKIILNANKVIEFGDAGETISGDGTSLTTTGGNIISIAEIKHLFRGNTIDIVNGSGVEVANIQSSTSDLSIDAAVQDKDLIFKGNDGGSTITALTLDMSAAGTAIFNHDVNILDNGRLNVGNAEDFFITHDTSNTVVRNQTGDLFIQTNASGNIFIEPRANERSLRLNLDGSVQLFHDGTEKFETTSTGIDVTGTAVTDGLTVAGNVSVDSGTIKLDGNYPTGTNNVALGDTALDSIGNGGAGHNVAIGHAALTADDTGTGNVGIGAFALTATVTGNYNTAIGQEALKANTSSENNAIGYQSMLTSYSGEKNVALGFWTLKNLGNNDKNVAIGHKAGLNLTGGDNNIIVGHNAQAASATTSNQITLGDANITSLRIPGLQSGASSGDVLTFDGTDIGFATPTGVSAGFAVAMAIAL